MCSETVHGAQKKWMNELGFFNTPTLKIGVGKIVTLIKIFN